MTTQISTQGRIADTAQKIANFKNLEEGWHFGGGVTPSDATISQASALNDEAGRAGFTRTNAFPGIDGEIRVTAYHGSIYLELTIEPSGQVTYVLEHDDDEVVYEENLSIDEALERIRAFWGTIWPSSGLSIAVSTIPTRSVFKVSPSNPPTMVVEYPSLARIAYSIPVLPSVSILNGSTETYQEALRYFGTSTPEFFLTHAG